MTEEKNHRTGRGRQSLDTAVHWVQTNDRWAHLLVFLVFAVLVCMGITTSSLTQAYLQPTLGVTEWILRGRPQEIRWDEYLGSSPTFMSILATADVPALSPLASQAGLVTRYSEGGFFASLVFFDATALRLAGFVPEQVLFSFRWWLPTVLVLTCMPMWFRRLGFDSRLGWMAGLLVVASPSVAWWSVQPVNVMGYTLAGCVALLAAIERLAARRWATGILLGALAAVLLAGMPAGYVVWAVMLGAPLLVVTALHVLFRKDLSLGLRWGSLGSMGAATLLLLVGVLWDLREGIAAIGATSYPGDRRIPAQPVAFETLFGAPATGAGAREEFVAGPAAGNMSELSTSWTISFFVVAAVLVSIGWVAIRSRWREWVPVGFLIAWGAAWLAWASVSLGDVSGGIPLFGQVPSGRAAQVVGILGVLAACMVISRLGTAGMGTPALGALAVLVGAVTLYAASLLQRTVLPDMGTVFVWLSALGAAVAVFIAIRWRARMWAVACVALLAAIPSITVNPLTVGLGAYRESDAAEYFAENADAVRTADEVWASDFRAMDVMMLANGLPSLTGPQPSGPDAEYWSRLDPTGEAEWAWNRGGSRISITWQDEGAGVSVTSPDNYNDIVIAADPCALHELLPELTAVMSRNPLDAACLREEHSIEWKDTPVTVYTFTDAGAA